MATPVSPHPAPSLRHLAGGIDLLIGRHRARCFVPHFHETYSVGMILEGTCRFTVDGRPAAAQAGQIVTFNPFAVHASHNTDGLVYAMLYVPVRTMPSLDGRPVRFEAPVVDDPQLFAALSGTCHPEVPGDGGPLPCAALADLVLRCGRPADGVFGHHDVDLVAKACSHLETRWDEPADYDDLARHLGISRGHFARLFRRTTGLAPAAFLRTVRLTKAKAFLQGGAAPADAAYLTGFCDQAHFSRHFSAVFGTTPGRVVLRDDVQRRLRVASPQPHDPRLLRTDSRSTRRAR